MADSSTRKSAHRMRQNTIQEEVRGFNSYGQLPVLPEHLYVGEFDVAQLDDPSPGGNG